MFLHYPFEVFSLFLNYSRVAQSVERQAVNLMVAGPSPAAGAIAENRDKGSRGGWVGEKYVPTGTECNYIVEIEGNGVRVLTGSESKGAGSSKGRGHSDKVDIVEMGKW